MGGFAFLTDDEQIRSISTTVDEVNGVIPVFGGLGETSTSRAVRMAKRIARTGVTHITILPPFYYGATQEALEAYFSEIAAAVDIAILLYDNPGATKNVIQPETIAELRSRIPAIVGIKVSNPDQVHLQAIVSIMAPDPAFSVFTGSEFLSLVGLQMGCDGVVGGSHNFCPHLAVDLYEAFRAGDIPRARQLQQELIAAWEVFRYGAIWGGFDEAMRYLGLCERATGRPNVAKLTPEEAQNVHRILDVHVRPYLAKAVQYS
jgi:dihydrodipicolinate synthase/N-acetylneuraminate lyase